jgi:hypothetical protein
MAKICDCLFPFCWASVCLAIAVIFFTLLRPISNFESQVKETRGKWSNEAVEVACFVERIPGGAYSTTCDPSCEDYLGPSLEDPKVPIPKKLWTALEGELFKEEERGKPNKCHKVGFDERIECPCRQELDMSPIQIRFNEALWNQDSDSCTTVFWTDDEGKTLSHRPSGDEPWLNTTDLRCLYLAGDSNVGDILRVNANRTALVELHKEVEETLLGPKIAFIICGAISLLCWFFCCCSCVRKSMKRETWMTDGAGQQRAAEENA